MAPKPNTRSRTARARDADGTEDRYMTIEDTCRRLNKWRAAVTALMLDREIDFERIAGRKLLLRASVDAYAERHGIAPPPTEEGWDEIAAER